VFFGRFFSVPPQAAVKAVPCRTLCENGTAPGQKTPGEASAVLPGSPCFSGVK